MERRLINARSLMRGRTIVRNHSMRNVNFTVITGDGSGYFLKGAVDQDTQRTLANEARVYAFLTSFESTHAFSVPMYAYDPDEHILILGVVRHATTLTQYYL